MSGPAGCGVWPRQPHDSPPDSFVARGARTPRTPTVPRSPVPPPPPPSFLTPAAAGAVAGLALALHLARLAVLGAQLDGRVAAHGGVARHAAQVAQLVQSASGAARNVGGMQTAAAARGAVLRRVGVWRGVRRGRAVGACGGGGGVRRGVRRTCGCAAAGRGVRMSGRRSGVQRTCDCGRPCRQCALKETRGAWMHRWVAQHRGARMSRCEVGGWCVAEESTGQSRWTEQWAGRWAGGGGVGRAVGQGSEQRGAP